MLRLLLTSIGATALVLPARHKTLRSPRLATPNSDDEPTFASLAQLEARLSVLADGTSSKLRNYHDPTLCSFLLEAVVTTNYSVTSSAICVETLLASGDAAALEEFQLFGPTCDALANAKWRPDDFLQAPLVVLALARLAGRDERSREVLADYAVRDRVRGAVQSLLERRPRLRDWRKQRLSSYIAYYLTAALLEVVDGAHDAGDGYGDDGEFRLLALLGIDRQDVGKALARSFAVARDELCRQLAAHAAGDGEVLPVGRDGNGVGLATEIDLARDRPGGDADLDELARRVDIVWAGVDARVSVATTNSHGGGLAAHGDSAERPWRARVRDVDEPDHLRSGGVGG